jgi:hypothetical protein
MSETAEAVLADIRAELRGLRTELRGEIQGLRSDMREDFLLLLARQGRHFYAALLATMLIVALALFVGVLLHAAA